MIDAQLLLSIILYILGIVLLIELIILCIKLIRTISKIDKVVDDVTFKSSKLDGIFNFVDTTTDALNSVGDKIVSYIITAITTLINNKKRRKEEDENE